MSNGNPTVGLYFAEFQIGKVTGEQRLIERPIELFKNKDDKRLWIRGLNKGEAALWKAVEHKVYLIRRARGNEWKTWRKEIKSWPDGSLE